MATTSTKGALNTADCHATHHAISRSSWTTSLRLSCLRVVILYGFTLGIFAFRMINGGWAYEKLWISGIVVSLLTVLHHTWTALGPVYFPISAGFDTVWVLLEVVFFLLFVFFINTPKMDENSHRVDDRLVQAIGKLTPDLPPPTPEASAQVFATVAQCALTVGLLGLFWLRILDIVNDTRSHPVSRRLNIANLPPSPWGTYALPTIFGRRLLQPAVPGESKWLILIRGILGIAAICLLLSFGITQAILAPLSEMEKTPNRQYKSTRLSGGTGAALGLISPQWKVVLVWPVLNDPDSTLDGMIEATTHFSSMTDATVVERPLACHIETGGTLALKDTRDRVAVVRCDSLTLSAGATEDAQPQSTVDFRRDWFLNFRISVNYTRKPSPETGLGSARDYSLREAVRAYLAIGYVDIGVVVEDTDPVVLYPGSNLLSFADVTIRQRLKGAMLSMLGFESSEVYPIVAIKQTISDPSVREESADSNVSTIRFSLLSNTGSWTIVQEYRSKSVLTALSTIGGLGSLLSTLLVMLLGTSLVGALLRTKQYSPFGLLHGVGPFRRQMVDKCEELYPRLRQDLRQLEIKPGVIAYIIDTHVDMEALGCDSYSDDVPIPMPDPGLDMLPDNASIREEERAEFMEDWNEDHAVEGEGLGGAMHDTPAPVAGA